ncbi:imidazolonepropionase [Chitinophaga costaii]|uniref:Imidazolonepropionase n=1 Tax=Chitinophaga costaii TaxID=1335309 RepID=A0A1C3Z721_9BACT|nr:imidazolonepropionase [Chitinophaga costaii]PUZ30253.1 imidazolonepropionase [Chitinophaga costaii]SCB78052.1 imidazolonepropionase [Chitinophaga costaii]
MLLIGPFAQILPLTDMPIRGPLQSKHLRIIENGGILVAAGRVVDVGPFQELQALHPDSEVQFIDTPCVLLPGFIDCHTHICFAGHRSRDYAMRIEGQSYLDIARAGGGIWDTVTQTRAATETTLVQEVVARAQRHLQEGVTTIEVKSGYGLQAEGELKMLRAIRTANAQTPATLVSTCLAAHLLPKDFAGTPSAYLQWINTGLLPQIQQEGLSNRVDIFVEETAFSAAEALPFLQAASIAGFELTLHADQFTAGSAQLAVAVHARSADHLEASNDAAIQALGQSDTVAVVLPGASLGLGMPYAPARRLLQAGAILAIGSDWNPGSAPMGDLLVQAAVMSAAEKLSSAEVFAGLTIRAAQALGLENHGVLRYGHFADLQAYPCADYRDILYYQGKMKPVKVWKEGVQVV